MVHLKSVTEIERIRTSCRIAAEAMLAVSEELKPGVTTDHLDQIADRHIRSQNAVASALGVLQGSPLLSLTRRSYQKTGAESEQIMDFLIVLYNPEQFQYSMDLTLD